MFHAQCNELTDPQVKIGDFKPEAAAQNAEDDHLPLNAVGVDEDGRLMDVYAWGPLIEAADSSHGMLLRSNKEQAWMQPWPGLQLSAGSLDRP